MRKVLLLIAIFSLLALETSGQNTTNVIPMNVSMNPVFYYYIELSDSLSDGVFFTNDTGSSQNVQYRLTSGTSDNDAIWNYNASSQKTEYWVRIAGTTPIDLCQGATNHLCNTENCSGPNNQMIDIRNVKWSVAYLNDVSTPAMAVSQPLIIGFDNNRKVGQNIVPPNDVYLRYWLAVPPNTPAYDYNTTYQIMAVVSGDSCA